MRGGVTAIAAIAVGAVPVAALAQAGSRQSAAAVFDAQRPGASTGLRLAIDYLNPSDPEAKPPAVQTVVTTLPAGTGIDDSVPARCAASDPELMASGPAACPPASKVGGGEIDLDTGVAGPGRLVQNDVTLLNNKGELVFLLESKGDPRSRTVSRASVSGTTIKTEVPPVPGGPPDGFLAIKRVRLSVQARSTGQGSSRRDYLSTPRSCPAGGTWTTTATFTYRDGVSQIVRSESPCTLQRGGARRDDKAPRIHLGGVPRNRCVRRAFRVRVRIAERWSGLRRARLSLDQRKLVVTRRKRFSRRIPPERLRSGLHRLTVVAVDNAGNRSTRRVRFGRCRR
jgi:hypothetical protein